MAKGKIVLIGGGGHARSCIDVIEEEGRFDIAGIIDLKEHIGQRVLGKKVIGCDDDLRELIEKYKNALVCIGGIEKSKKRKEAYETIKRVGGRLPTVLSPKAQVSKHAQLGEGTIVMHHAVINAAAVIGNNCIINTGAIIEHDVVLGDHIHVSTGSIINGQTRVGNESFIGSQSVVNENLIISENVVVGSKTVVTKSLTDAGTYVGIPARRIK